MGALGDGGQTRDFQESSGGDVGIFENASKESFLGGDCGGLRCCAGSYDRSST